MESSEGASQWPVSHHRRLVAFRFQLLDDMQRDDDPASTGGLLVARGTDADEGNVDRPEDRDRAMLRWKGKDEERVLLRPVRALHLPDCRYGNTEGLSRGRVVLDATKGNDLDTFLG